MLLFVKEEIYYYARIFAFVIAKQKAIRKKKKKAPASDSTPWLDTNGQMFVEMQTKKYISAERWSKKNPNKNPQQIANLNCFYNNDNAKQKFNFHIETTYGRSRKRRQKLVIG